MTYGCKLVEDTILFVGEGFVYMANYPICTMVASNGEPYGFSLTEPKQLSTKTYM